MREEKTRDRRRKKTEETREERSRLWAYLLTTDEMRGFAGD
jgi:hypothetical protein